MSETTDTDQLAAPLDHVRLPDAQIPHAERRPNDEGSWTEAYLNRWVIAGVCLVVGWLVRGWG